MRSYSFYCLPLSRWALLVQRFGHAHGMAIIGDMGAVLWGWTWGAYGSPVNPAGSYQDFLLDTVTIRKELAANSGEYSALAAQPNPDPKRAGQLSKEIAALHLDEGKKPTQFQLTAKVDFATAAV